MHHHTIFTSILVSLILIVTQITAQKCLLYNTLSLPVVYHDVCVRGTCMNANTFMPDFDLPRFPKTNDPSDGYRYSPRTINGYQQNFCAAITPSPTDLSLRPTGCNSPDCSDSACTFDSITGLSRGLVQSTLGADGFPRWRNNKAEGRKSIASETTFNKWYYDSTATIRIESELNLTRKGHTQTFQYEEPNFFPLDGRGYWSFDDKQEDQNRKLRNFGFTTAIISEFVYTGGENFTFRGDDDVWVFIDNQLAIDIGGLHSPECRAIILDEAANSGVGKVYTCTTVESTVNAGNARAGETYTISGLTIGSRHTLSIFHAERHEEGSSFAMSTSIGFNAGDIGGLDYTLPSATGARIYIGTYQFIRLGRVDSAPDPIQLPIYAGTPQNTAITITLEFPPTDQTQIICRILQLNSTIITAMQLNDVDRNTIPSPLDVTAVKAAANQATWASVITEADHVQTSCTNNEKDQPSWTITVRTTGGGSGYLYCIADAPGVSYSDYTAAGRARDTNFYRKWVATSITSLAPTTLPPTTEPPSTLPPTTEAPTTLPPVITTQPPTTAAPTDAPTTAAPTPTPTPTDASTTLSPTTLPPTTTTPTPTDAATTAPPTTPTPTESSTTQPPTTTPTPTTTTTPTVTSAPTTTSAPNTDAPTNAITTAPPTSTPTPTPTATPAPTNAITTSPPTSISTPTPTMTIAPTDTPTPFVNPTDAPTPTSTPSSSSSTGIAVSSAASNGSSDIIQLQYVVPVAVAGVIVIVALVWGSIVCWKRRKNNVFRTHGSHMEMV